MSGLRQTARLLEAADRDAQHKPTLFQLAIDAHYSAQAFTDALQRDLTDFEYNRLDETAFNAMQALLAALWDDHGIDRQLARKIGAILL